MDHSDRWVQIEELGQGGQGKVCRVMDKERFDVDGKLRPAIEDYLGLFGNAVGTLGWEENRATGFARFQDAVVDLIGMQDPSFHGALKVLHKPEDARDPERAQERMTREMQAMSEAKHPNLLAILDSDPDHRWYVSEFHPHGSLDKNLSIFAGDTLSALKTFRPIVEGVCELHKCGIVHRDIKPHNVFIAQDHRLVLGDFGLVFFTDDKHTRLSATLENVGTRDWMPPWAYGMRIQDIRPSFDVFSLGKLLWSMVSGKLFLQLWYYDREPYDLKKQFPDVNGIDVIVSLLSSCIVEFENDCRPDAVDLLQGVDWAISKLDYGGDILDPDAGTLCRLCGSGRYSMAVDRDPSKTKRFGLSPMGSLKYRVFMCDYCGNIQLFAFRGDQLPNWHK